MKTTLRGVLAVIFVLAVAAVCVRLGFWQLDRLEQRRERNAAIRAAGALPPLRLDSATLREVAADPGRFVHRRVVVRGSYDPTHQVVLRGRAHEGRPGVHLAAPLRVPGADVAVLVNRGWVPAPDAATVPPGSFAEPGPRTVQGVLQPVPSTADRGSPSAAPAGGAPTYRRLDLDALRGRVPYPLLPLYVEQRPGPGDPEYPRRVPPPEVGEGPHLGYAVQWFSFAAIALVGLGVLLLRARGRER